MSNQIQGIGNYTSPFDGRTTKSYCTGFRLREVGRVMAIFVRCLLLRLPTYGTWVDINIYFAAISKSSFLFYWLFKYFVFYSQPVI